MRNEELLAQISELTEEIARLPKGYISQKTISGKVYYYHQWSENGRKKSKYLKDAEIEQLSREINRRKELQERLKLLRSGHKTPRSEATQMQYVLMHKEPLCATLSWMTPVDLYGRLVPSMRRSICL